MSYLLSEVCEREIRPPKLFSSYQQAYRNMCKRVAQVLDIQPKVLEKADLEEELCGYNAGVAPFAAWAEGFHSNYDWKIFNLEETCPKEEPTCAS